jgi:hypothetical protein
MAFDISRRRALKGAMGLTVGLPLLDAMLDVNGTALAATGTTVPVRFGTWFWGLGVNPSRWFPDKAGANYELKPELAPIKALQGKINILGNFDVPLDGAPNLPHISGGAAVRTGRALTADRGLPATRSARAAASAASRPRRSVTRAIRSADAAAATSIRPKPLPRGFTRGCSGWASRTPTAPTSPQIR